MIVNKCCGPHTQIDLFGEIAGTSFSPDGDRFFLAIADLTYSSLLEYHLTPNLRSGGGGGSYLDDPFGDNESGSGGGGGGGSIVQAASAADDGNEDGGR